MREFFKGRMHDPPEGAGALAVDDAYLENALLTAGFEVITHKVLDLIGLEDMKVENAVEGKFKGIHVIHE
jgi:UDP-3-O-acyl-N-acetylglucosamine deacetylase